MRTPCRASWTAPTSPGRTRRGSSCCSRRRRATAARRWHRSCACSSRTASRCARSSTAQSPSCTRATRSRACPPRWSPTRTAWSATAGSARSTRVTSGPRSATHATPASPPDGEPLLARGRGARGGDAVAVRAVEAGRVVGRRHLELLAFRRRRDARATGLVSHRRVDEPADLRAVERLALEQRARHRLEAGPVLAEHLAGAVLLLAEDALDLLVDDARGLVGVVAGVDEVLAQEHRALRSPRHRSDAVGHAPLAHHLARELGAADEVVLRARREMAVHQLLGDAPTEAHHQRVGDVVLLVDVTLLDGELLRHTQRHAGWQDRHLVDGVGVLEDVGEDRVTAFVVRDDLLLLLAERHRLPLETHEDA